MSELELSMQNILNGAAGEMGAEIVAIAKIIQAAEILSQSGYEDEADEVLAALKEDDLEKVASIKEETLFEVEI